MLCPYVRKTWPRRHWLYTGISPILHSSRPAVRASQPQQFRYSRVWFISGYWHVCCQTFASVLLPFLSPACNTDTISSFLRGDADRLQAYNPTLCYSGICAHLFTHFVLSDIPLIYPCRTVSKWLSSIFCTTLRLSPSFRSAKLFVTIIIKSLQDKITSSLMCSNTLKLVGMLKIVHLAFHGCVAAIHSHT